MTETETGGADPASADVEEQTQPGWRERRHGLSSPLMTRAAWVAAAGASGFSTLGSATGLPLADSLWRGGLAATVAAAASTTPTWVLVVLSSASAILGVTAGPIAVAAGVAAFLLSVVLAMATTDRSWLQPAVGALSVTALLRLADGPGVGVTATALLSALVVIAGVRGCSRRRRRQASFALVGLLGLGSVAAVLGGLAGLKARAPFERSSTATAAALSAARSGDASGAAAKARVAAADLREARKELGVWWARPGWAVPVVGAHLRAGEEVARGAGPAVEAAASSAEVLRLDVLRAKAGRLDLDRLAATQPEFARLRAALDEAQSGALLARSPWLVGPLQDRLGRYEAQLASVTRTSDRALLAVEALPRLLGAERPTRWFIAVANPAESRELGGCLCDFAVVVADEGAIRLERAGTVTEIGSFKPGRTLAGIDLPRRYVGQRPEVFWQNVSGYPDLPTVATAVRALWEQVTPSSPIDGVVYVDPRGLAALLKLAGPVTAPAPLGSLTAENAAKLLMEDQYARFSETDDRKDALHEAAAAAFTALSTASLPGPAAIGAALGPAVQGGHLLVSSFDPGGQRLFDEIGASGRLPASDGGDLASLRTTNLVENKLDPYLRRSVRYQAVVDPGTRRVEATATIELRNEAVSELPKYVAGNSRDLPWGTNVLAVAWYSGLPLEVLEVDGRPTPVASSYERGWWTHSVTVTVPAGTGAKVVFRLAGEIAATHPYRLSVAPQAAAGDDSYAVEVTGRSGWRAAPLPDVRPGRRTDLVVPFRAR